MFVNVYTIINAIYLFIKVLKPQKVQIFFPLNYNCRGDVYHQIMIGGNFYIEYSQQ